MGSIRSVCYWASWYMMLEKERKKKNTPINWTHFSCTVFVLKKLVPLQSRSWVSFNKWNHVVQSTSKVYELLSLQPWNAARYLDFQHVLVLYANNVVLHGFTGYSHKLLEIQKKFFFWIHQSTNFQGWFYMSWGNCNSSSAQKFERIGGHLWPSSAEK